MGLWKKIKKALSGESFQKKKRQEVQERSKPKQQKVVKSDHSNRQKTKYADRAPNVQKMKAESAYRAKRQVKFNKSVSGMSKGQKQTFKTNTQKSPVQRFNAGALQSGAFMGLPKESNMPKSVRNSTSYKVGKLVGTGASYLTGYSAVGKGLAKQAAKQTAKRTIARDALRTSLKSTKVTTGKVLSSDLLKSSVKTSAPKSSVKTVTHLPGIKGDMAKVAVTKIPKGNVVKSSAKAATKFSAAKAAEKAAVKKATKYTVGEKAVQRLAKTKAVRASAEKAVKKRGLKEGTKFYEREVEKVAREKAKKVAFKVKQQVVADATVGTALDTAHARGEGIKMGSKEHAKYLAESAALNVAFGVGGEAAAKGAKAAAPAIEKAAKAVAESAPGNAVVQAVKRGKDKSVIAVIDESGKQHYKVVKGEKARNIEPGDVVESEVKEIPDDAIKAAPESSEAPTGHTVDFSKDVVKTNKGKYKVYHEDGKRRVISAEEYAAEKERVFGPKKEGEKAKVASLDADVERGFKNKKEPAGPNFPRMKEGEELPPEAQQTLMKQWSKGREPDTPITKPLKAGESQKFGGVQTFKKAGTLRAATEDAEFVEKVRKGDIDVKKIAEDNGISTREAVVKAHQEYVDSINSIGPKAGNEESQAADTLFRSELQTEESQKAMQEWRDNAEFNKRTESHEEALKKAQTKVDADGYDKAAQDFNTKVDSKARILQEDIATASLCLDDMIKKGEYDKANELMLHITIAESETGRTLQAMRMFRAQTPAGKVATLQRQVEKLAKQKGVEIKVEDKYYDAIKNAKTEKEIIEANKNFQKHVWDQIPANWVEKANAWRYLAMLGNPKTHIRNIMGNLIFMPVRKMDDILASGMEKVLKPSLMTKENRTKAIITKASPSDRALLKLADESWESGTGEMLRLTSGKYLENGSDNVFSLAHRPSESRVFKTKPVDFASQKNAAALDREDLAFMKPAYCDYYAQYLKAKGYTARTATDEVKQAAEKYAGEHALRATYREMNVIADHIRKLKQYASMKTSEIPTQFEGDKAALDRRAKKVAGVAIESLMPFTKTPANILARGIEHSPFGLMRGVADIMKAKTAEQAVSGIERIAAGMTGSSLMMLGAYMGSKGMANGSIDYSDKGDKYRLEQGKQAYSFQIGDHNYTMDWAAPLSMPFFVGVEIGKGKDTEDVLAALSKIQEPLFNLTMLQSLNNALNNQWSDGTGITNSAKKIAEGYAGQYLPTVGGQIARTIQADTSGTLATDQNKTVREFNRWKNQMKNKVPGLADTNEPKLDSFGEKETKKTERDYAKAALLNFISPGNYKESKNDPVAREILKLSDDGASDSVIPNTKPNKYTVKIGDEEAPLTPKEYTKMQEIAGKESRKKLTELFNSKEYKNMDMAEKEKAISGIYTDAKKTAKVDVLREKGYSDTDIAWDNYLSSQQRKKYETKGAFEKDLRKAGITARKFEDYADKGATLAQVKKAKERGVDVDTFIGAMQTAKGSKSYGERLGRWIDKGYVKSFDELLVYDPQAENHKGTWNSIAWAKNNGMSTKQIRRVLGTDTATDDSNRKRMKKYGQMGNGAVSTDGIHQWIEKEHGDLKRKEKALLWKYYGGGWAWFQNRNPYL